MKSFHSLTAFVALAPVLLSACGSSDATGSPKNEAQQRDPEGFNPPPAPDGFTRIVAPVIEDIQPGDDVMYCQYVQAPFDRDMDLLKVGGYQSQWGHHVVAFATTATAEVGTSRLCQGEDNLSGAFLGGVGGEAGEGAPLPEGVAFRLPKGNGIMLNTHFLNAGDAAIQGEGVLDVQFAEVDPDRVVAGFFVNIQMGFSLAPNQPSTADSACVATDELAFLAFANHMHDFGTSAFTEVVRADGAVELIRDDPAWTYEMQFRAEYTKWDVASPYLLRKGDTLHTHCEWQNTSADALSFPREMCIGVGFYIATGGATPSCFNDTWVSQGLMGGGGGGAALAGPPCAAEGAVGNEVGVGRQCSAKGGECTGGATICLADYTTGEFGNFCTKLCAADADCGAGAVCTSASGSSTKTCLPSTCVSSVDAGASG